MNGLPNGVLRVIVEATVLILIGFLIGFDGSAAAARPVSVTGHALDVPEADRANLPVFLALAHAILRLETRAWPP